MRLISNKKDMRTKRKVFQAIFFNLLGGIIGSFVFYFITNQGGIILATFVCCFICIFAETSLNYGCIIVWLFALIYTLFLFVMDSYSNGFNFNNLLLYIAGQIYSFFICFLAYKWNDLK